MTAAASALRVEPLSDRHERERFTRGVEALDRYLRRQVGQDARRRVTSCFVLLADDNPAPIGYYTLAATSIALAELPEALAKRLPRYPVVPATLMGARRSMLAIKGEDTANSCSSTRSAVCCGMR